MKFDGVFSNNVLEHLPDPVSELKFMKSLLRDEKTDLMAHATPCFEYAYEYTRFHLVFYTGGSIASVARQIGSSVEILPKVTHGRHFSWISRFYQP